MRREHGIISGYADVESIHAVGICYINTGLTTEPQTTLIRCEWKSKFVQLSRSSMIALSYSSAGLQVYNSNGNIYNQGVSRPVANGSINECWSETTSSRRIINVNGVQSSQWMSRSITDNQPIYIFNSPTEQFQLQDDIFYMRIYINSVLRREYVPKKRLADGVYGLYDNVSGNLETGIGGGYFTI